MPPRKPADRGVIAILRPAPEGGVMAAALRRRGIAAVATPVIRIRFTGRAGALNPRDFPALTLFTSPRGVIAEVRRLSPVARSRLRKHHPAAAGVGPATAAAARAAGYRVVAGQRANGAIELQRELERSRLFQKLERGADILVVSPERDNPLPIFIHRLGRAIKTSWQITRRADYGAAPHPAGIRRLAALLRRRSLGGLIVGSPRQMELLWKKTLPRDRTALLPLPCIVPGQTTASALRRHGFRNVFIVAALGDAGCARMLKSRSFNPPQAR